MVICLFYSDISAQISRSFDYEQLGEVSSDLLGPCPFVTVSPEFTYTANQCCATFNFAYTADGPNEFWDFGDGTRTGRLQRPFTHRYRQPGIYTVKHGFFGGPDCEFSKTVVITSACVPPPICNLDIDISQTTGSIDCTPGIIGSNDNPTESTVRCRFGFSPLLNNIPTSVGIFKWEITIEDAAYNEYFRCNRESTSVGFATNGLGYYLRIKLTASQLSCGGSGTKTKRIFINAVNPLVDCIYGDAPLRPVDDNENQGLIRKMITTNNVQIYPNPVSDFLRISNLNDSDNYTFDIHNTLGQTVLSQKVSSIDASVNVTDLETGIYIGVVKSQGKIIATQKIYKK